MSDLRLRAFIASLKNRSKFKSVETYCMFIGYPRSGHSLIGSLLNAHPEMVIAHELNALKYVARGASRAMLYSLIMEQDRDFERLGRQWTEYDYHVPKQWQGRYQTIRVIGDKKGGRSTRELEQDEQLIERLQKLTRARVRMIHIVRNPYDNIATMFKRKNTQNDALLEQSIDNYFHRSAFIEGLISGHNDIILTMKYEDFVAQPKVCLKQLGKFLGVECSDDYVQDCASLVNETPSRSRSKIQWSQPLIDGVAERLDKIAFLKGYTYSS